MKQEIDAGETFDVAISITSGIDDWIKEGKIVAATRAAVAYAILAARGESLSGWLVDSGK